MEWSNLLSPIKQYIELLRQVSVGTHPLERFSKSDTLGTPESDQVSLMLKQLSNDGLVHLQENQIGTSYQVTITPKGALALLEWTDKLEEKSFLSKLKGSTINFIWLVVGALLTYIVRTNS